VVLCFEHVIIFDDERGLCLFNFFLVIISLIFVPRFFNFIYVVVDVFGAYFILVDWLNLFRLRFFFQTNFNVWDSDVDVFCSRINRMTFLRLLIRHCLYFSLQHWFHFILQHCFHFTFLLNFKLRLIRFWYWFWFRILDTWRGWWWFTWTLRTWRTFGNVIIWYIFVRYWNLGLLFLLLDINAIHNCVFHQFLFLRQIGNDSFFFITFNLVLVLSQHRIDDSDLLLFKSFLSVVVFRCVFIFFFLRDT
jgi:hypothetical protein